MPARPLREYDAKRDFASTPEPGGPRDRPSERRSKPAGQRDKPSKRQNDKGRQGGGRFVVQEHHARSLHWDLRLERDGVLVSWAVPKGIPLDPKTNRLAVHVEDHPLDYIDFAGEIPAGSYGAGSVQIWDAGAYDCHKFRDEEVIVTLHGERVQGKYALFQTDGKNWMIHRMDPPQDSATRGDARAPRPDAGERRPAACPTKRSGRSRSSGTAFGRSSTGSRGDCDSRAATAATSARAIPSCVRSGSSWARARRCSTERSSPSTSRACPASSACNGACTSPRRAPSGDCRAKCP